MTPNDTIGKALPAKADQKAPQAGQGDQPAVDKAELSPPPLSHQIGLAAYLCVLFALLLAAMLWLWSSIPVVYGEAGRQEQPATRSASGEGDTSTMPAAAEKSKEAPPKPSADGAQKKPATGRLAAVREDVRVLCLVLVMGALGGVLYGMIGFCYHLALSDFEMKWKWWYLFRPLLGAGIALLLFLATQGGFLTPASGINYLSLYGTTALAGICGMFSEQASKKLSEVFKTLFRTKEDLEVKQKDEALKKAAEARSPPGGRPAEQPPIGSPSVTPGSNSAGIGEGDENALASPPKA